MAMAQADGRTSLANALSVYFHNIGKREGATGLERPTADFGLSQRVKSCVHNEVEFKAWGRLFAFSIMRNDHFCFEAAENAARIRVSH
ncbi:hypothetical protein M3P21_22330, partial [Ruegeria sp. 2012CJ41-6]